MLIFRRTIVLMQLLVQSLCVSGRPVPDGYWHRVLVPEVVLIQLSFWRWAQSCSKHVEDSNKHIIEETVRQVGHLAELNHTLLDALARIPQLAHNIISRVWSLNIFCKIHPIVVYHTKTDTRSVISNNKIGCNWRQHVHICQFQTYVFVGMVTTVVYSYTSIPHNVCPA